jgi:hypothetical protein
VVKERGVETVEEALEVNDADGTASVIDISTFCAAPEAAKCWQLTDKECEKHLGSAKPEAVYFAGWSFD